MAVKRKPQKRQAQDIPQSWPENTDQLLPGRLAWSKVYWVVGPMPQGAGRARNEVKDPPNAGWSSVIVIPGGGRRVILFCPYSFDSHSVTEDSLEYSSLGMPRDRIKRTKLREMLYHQWAQMEKFGFQKDYDTAAKIMQLMGWEVPMRVVPPVDLSAPETKRRGKEAAAKLTKPIPRTGRRGEVLSWFMESLEPRSIREAMAQFNTTRSNILTILFQLNKEHGLGYRLAGDAAEIEFPAAGCDKLFS